MERSDTTTPGNAMEQPDPHLPRLTIAQAGRLRGLAASHFIRDGVKVRSKGDSFTEGDWVYDLHNLADKCRAAGPDAWPELVAEHLSGLRKALQNPPSEDTVRERAFRRLLPADMEFPGGMDGFRYVRSASEGLIEALSVDMPDTVALINDDDVARIGLDELRRTGEANLLAEPVDYNVITSESGGKVHTLSGGSFFVASKALVLAETMHAKAGFAPPEDGVMLMVPTRSLLLFYPLRDSTVFDSIQAMVGIGLQAHDDGPGQLSRRLYWWRAGNLMCVGRDDPDRSSFAIMVPPDLQTIMERLVV
jgi:hypothetical protein